MSVLKKFENNPRPPAQGRQGSCRPSNGRQDLNVIFLNLQRGPWLGVVWREGVLSPPNERQGPVAPPRATGGLLPYISPGLHASIPFSFEPKNYTKNSKKKRGEEKKSGEVLPNGALVIYR